MNFIRNHKKMIVYGLIGLAVVIYFARYHNAKDDVSYITEPVKRQNIEKVVNAAGEVRAIELVTVGAQVSGKIENLYVTIGQQVKKGDLIAEIDSTTQQNDVDVNKVRLKSYQAQLSAAKVALKIAEKQYQRTLALRKKNAASVEDLENDEDAYETANAHVAELTAAVKETEISLDTAQTDLGYTKITAPLDGTIVSVPVKIGQTVNAAMNTPTIVQIADLSQMEVLIEISEGDIANVKPGIKVAYSILADLENNFETTLKSIDPGLTLLTNAEYTEVVGNDQAIYYYGRLIVPNEHGKLRIGMTTQNILYVGKVDNALSVPAPAIKHDAQGKYVDILDATGVVKKYIETGLSDGLNVEVTEGLNEGDEVVLAKLSSSEISEKTSKFSHRRF